MMTCNQFAIFLTLKTGYPTSSSLTMRFTPRWVCVISYCGCMSYGVHFSANQLGGLKKVCVTREYALSRLWVMRESTVFHLFSDADGPDPRPWQMRKGNALSNAYELSTSEA